MDSNRKFIEFNKLFKEKEIDVIQCGSAEAMNNILNNRDIVSDEILVHVGTNDLETKEPNLVAKEIANLVKRLKTEYKVYVSEIIIRDDYLNNKVYMTNALLKQELNKEIEDNTIILIKHANINSRESLHDKKHLSYIRKGELLSGVEQLSLDFYNHIDGSSNGIELLKSIRRDRQHNRTQRYTNYRNTTHNRGYHDKNQYKYSRFNKSKDMAMPVNNEYYKYNQERNIKHVQQNNLHYKGIPQDIDTRYVDYFTLSNGFFGTQV